MTISYFVANAEADSHETPSRPAKGSQADRRIDIQPAEDEEGNERSRPEILSTFLPLNVTKLQTKTMGTLSSTLLTLDFYAIIDLSTKYFRTWPCQMFARL